MAENTEKLSFQINAQFLKNLSFDNPKSVKSLKKLEKAPSLKLNADVKSSKLNDEGEDIYEVNLVIKGETSSDKDVLFKLESEYTGIFTIQNAKDDILDRILKIECPKFLFPYIRAVISNTTREAGFPPLSVAPLDFASLYNAKKTKKKK